jgi:hypothetical protein
VWIVSCHKGPTSASFQMSATWYSAITAPTTSSVRRLTAPLRAARARGKSAGIPQHAPVLRWTAGQSVGSLRKGSLAYYEGSLEQATRQTQEGEARCGLNVSAWRVDVHGGIG